ncbi:ATP-binding cassette domain-containing protein [uncultured Tenacibaculum sp.]|uniref:ATP-binding cassette domain-containing protein n=1 Tax=uncultured Tenacibaculum sp. TaxID=174713 RepID=UPI002605B92B|nr:ATP-binding cassette domain-containing protein [uncultured Tenacibaculum sp.]
MKLEAFDINKRFGKKTILNNINITCNTGDIIGVFGRNGSGKSTLLKILFGSINANSIDLRIDAKQLISKQIISKKLISYLPQQSFLPKEKSVREIIPLFFSNAENQENIFYNPKIASIVSQKVGTLSLGELRYLELLLIGNLEHPFLLLDEPFSMIEPKYIAIISSLLTELKEKKGIMITDHYYKNVLKITTDNFLLKDGNKIEIKTEEDLVMNNYLSE